MDLSSSESNESGVDEGAFWHTNMDLYYGYMPGEVVEVEHESNKYWLATIQYCFKHLVLLKWIGNNSEFWIDTSMSNSTTSSSGTFNDFNSPKRLFPLGYHLQSQLKSQFTLEKPTKALEKPSLYNPSKDPYAEIKTVDDLLAHELEQANDAFANQTPANNIESASLVLVKCKTKINYGQEDVDELEAALQNLNDIDSNGVEQHNESPATNSHSDKSAAIAISNETHGNTSKNICINKSVPINEDKLVVKDEIQLESKYDPGVDDQSYLELCKKLQDNAINNGRYMGINHSGEDNSHQVFFLKPKQFFDVGGANHERVFVPGTLIEVCHTSDGNNGLEVLHWPAFVVKNVGGRLTLRWFLCDEPKFKQGRLEMRSCRSKFIQEEEEISQDEDSGSDGKECDDSEAKSKAISAKTITFSMHFCNPCIHTICHAKSFNRSYKMPTKISSYIESTVGSELFNSIEKTQLEHVFDVRRMNLDKDRPLIDHILSTARFNMPTYLDLIFAQKDEQSSREVLISSPRMTKLVKGFIKREIESGVFEVHSEPISDSGEIIKFVYPYSGSYTILPIDWATSNQDCLLMNLSRNESPISDENALLDQQPENDQLHRNESEVDKKILIKLEQPDSESLEDINACLKGNRITFPKVGGPFKVLSELVKTNIPELKSFPNFDELDPACWSQILRSKELNASKFHFCLDNSLQKMVASKFKVMNQLEVVHPSSDVTICLGRIRKVVFPLLWIQISADSYTLLPFDSTDIYPNRWCETYNHPLVSLLPPRKRCIQSTEIEKKRKKAKVEDIEFERDLSDVYEKEHFDLGALNDKQSDIDYILNEKSTYIRIYFNHKCFTGPSLSKGKICSLPQYVGPGPFRLVMEEVVTKVISVAYVPPRILNDLSSKSFEQLLIARNLTNTAPMEFKAKYQKRVHRETIPVCLKPDDVALYCECLCEHLKCCYNLFGPNLYDGDDCPGHCRALTKSNKFMKRATYYREKARLGEFLSDNNGPKKPASNSSNSSLKTSRARYAGRDSSESTSSSMSRSEQLNSRASSTGEEAQVSDLKENLMAVEELDDAENNSNDGHQPNKNIDTTTVQDRANLNNKDLDMNGELICSNGLTTNSKESDPEVDNNKVFCWIEQEQNVHNNSTINRNRTNSLSKWSSSEPEFNILNKQELNPEDWTIDEVVEQLEWCHLGKFKPLITSEGIDGQALLLLDKAAIREHFQQQMKPEYSSEEVNKLCRFVEFIKAQLDTDSVNQ